MAARNRLDIFTFDPYWLGFSHSRQATDIQCPQQRTFFLMHLTAGIDENLLLAESDKKSLAGLLKSSPSPENEAPLLVLGSHSAQF
jgi:hypothetical protein